nr:MAG TPA_asm: putative deoxyuridine 5' triphosphate nucleotidohydrolase [Caudoviricetes sp.]
MYGFISGYTVSDNINFCPRCADRGGFGSTGRG